MRLTVLGCGGSGGVPITTGFWGNCDANNPKNTRTRTSLAIETSDDQVWLIDTGPDVRQQLLRENIRRVDGVFYTHAHADHVMGLDDLRAMCHFRKALIPLYCDQVTREHLLRIFCYCIEGGENFSPLYKPLFRTMLFPHSPFLWKGHKVHVFTQDHGPNTISLGFRFGAWAYSTDVKNLSEDAFQILQGVQTWFVDCTSLTEKPTHAHLDQTLAWIQRVQPKQAILVHMGPEIDYATLSARLPTGVECAFDGMKIEIEI